MTEQMERLVQQIEGIAENIKKMTTLAVLLVPAIFGIAFFIGYLVYRYHFDEREQSLEELEMTKDQLTSKISFFDNAKKKERLRAWWVKKAKILINKSKKEIAEAKDQIISEEKLIEKLENDILEVTKQYQKKEQI